MILEMDNILIKYATPVGVIFIFDDLSTGILGGIRTLPFADLESAKDWARAEMNTIDSNRYTAKQQKSESLTLQINALSAQIAGLTDQAAALENQRSAVDMEFVPAILLLEEYRVKL
jgi:hypothetical protein